MIDADNVLDLLKKINIYFGCFYRIIFNKGLDLLLYEAYNYTLSVIIAVTVSIQMKHYI